MADVPITSAERKPERVLCPCASEHVRKRALSTTSNFVQKAWRVHALDQGHHGLVVDGVLILFVAHGL